MEMSTQEIVNLSDICRACLVKTANMKNLLEANDEIIQLVTKLASISNLEVEINETLPCFLCQNCEEKLRISYDFQQLVQKSHHFILACISATNTLKVNNALKPLSSSDQPVELHVEHNSDGLINFVANENLETEIQVGYKDYDVSSHVDSKRNYVINEQESTIQTDNFTAGNKISETNKSKNSENKKDNESLDKAMGYIKPQEVEKKMKNNQTMRLAQYSVEEIDRLIKKTRERFFKHVNCLYCGFTARYSRSLSVHMTRLHKELKENWCLWCNQSYGNLKEHLKVIHRDDFKCPLCGKLSTSTSHFLEHLASHSIERKHICKLCQKCFISARHLKMHYRVHTNDKPYSCPECSKGFVLIKSLKSHLKTHKKHRCKICKNCFDSDNDYNVHKCVGNGNIIEENDSDSSNLEEPIVNNTAKPQNFCEECNKKVRSLQYHKDKFHSNVKRNKNSLGTLCAYCGKQFRSLAKLTVHVRIHTGEAPYKCSYCDKRTTTRFHLVVHERTHTGEKPYICNVCGKAFAQSSVLNTHMKLHTGRPEQCSICLKRFCRGSELRQHMRKHTEKKPYRCSLCSYACRQSYSLTQHMVQHENDQPKAEKPHMCGICDRGFTTVAMFSSHYVSKHTPLDDTHIVADNLGAQGDRVIDNLDPFTQ